MLARIAACFLTRTVAPHSWDRTGVRMGREGLEWEPEEMNVDTAVRLGTDEGTSLFEDKDES